MLDPQYRQYLAGALADLSKQGLFKKERVMTTPQGGRIETNDGGFINLCANNYLGLANEPELVQAAQQALTEYGYGMASVRFICGTSSIHRQLEQELADFLGMEDAILYSSCFDANAGLFETLLGREDAIISDSLNHASIIDGVRLCKAQRFRYRNNDMDDLEAKLKDAAGCQKKMIATDGIFSMDGICASLAEVCDLAERYGAMVMVDDSHAVGFMGEQGRGTHEHCQVMGRVDLMTGTLGKALGGASGGYTAGPKEVIDWLRQRSRPYLFSNSLAPMITATSLKVLSMIKQDKARRQKLHTNARTFRRLMTEAGFELVPGEHPIIPVMVYDAAKASRFADQLLQEGVYVISFSYPVVPQGLARIRTQMCAAHSEQDLQQAAAAFAKVGQQLGIIS